MTEIRTRRARTFDPQFGRSAGLLYTRAKEGAAIVTRNYLRLLYLTLGH